MPIDAGGPALARLVRYRAAVKGGWIKQSGISIQPIDSGVRAICCNWVGVLRTDQVKVTPGVETHPSPVTPTPLNSRMRKYCQHEVDKSFAVYNMEAIPYAIT
jgi:hypothetical protein